MNHKSFSKGKFHLSQHHHSSLQDFHTTLIPILTVSHLSLIVLLILGGFAAKQWIIILSIASIQTLGIYLLIMDLKRWENKTLLTYGIVVLNWTAEISIVILSGGYPSPFWLTFIIGAIYASIFLNRTAVYVISILSALSLGLPRLSDHLDNLGLTIIGAQSLTTLFTGIVVYNVIILLKQERDKHHETEKALREVNDMLAVSVAQLERRAQENTLLTELGNALQSCANSNEAYDIMETFFAKLFPYENGALFLYRLSRDELEAVVNWGNYAMSGGVQEYEKDDCWALRRGQLYRLDDPALGLVCRHVKYPPQAQYVCVPLIAHGETLGVLHIQSQKGAPTIPTPGQQSRIDAIATLADDVADHIALAIANQQLRETLRIQSIRDALTGLFNRRYMEETLEREIRQANRQEIQLGIIMLDIDHFKTFNDINGHEAGDIALTELGTYLKTHIRGSDVACRYGGEEFLIILPNTSLEKTHQRAEELRLGIKQMNIKHHGQVLSHNTVSLGVAIYPDMGINKESLLQAVDNALYKAKDSGRDCVVIADSTKVGL